MCDLVRATGLILVVSISLCSNLHFVSGEKPQCKGDALKPDDFSKNDEVGLVRDLLVDVLARNLFNLLGCEVPGVCEDLAKIRTSTCVGKCFKWKRNGCWGRSATPKIMAKAEALVEHINTVISSKESLKNVKEEKVISKHIKEVTTRLVTSGAADNKSKIFGQLKTMEKLFCKNYLLEEALRKEKAEKFLQNEDVKDTIAQFTEHIKAEYKNIISEYHLEVIVVEAGDNMQSGIIRLIYKWVDGKIIWKHSVILKIPSLSHSPFDVLETTNILDREVYFYKTVLPELYRLGKCKPFAPQFYIATSTRALVMEDLTFIDYRPGNRVKQLNYHEAEATLTVLATCHAAGLDYLENLDEDDPNIPLVEPRQHVLMSLMGKTKTTTFDKFIELIKSSITESLLERILALKSRILVDPSTKATSLIVLIHADCQANNILFKYDDKGIPSDVKLIDWQYSRAGNIAVELIYFFVTCVPIDIFENSYDLLLRNYVQVLDLKIQLGPQEKSGLFENLKKDLYNSRYYFLNVISTHWQNIMSVGASEELSNVYVTRAIKWVNYLDKKGFI